MRQFNSSVQTVFLSYLASVYIFFCSLILFTAIFSDSREFESFVEMVGALVLMPALFFMFSLVFLPFALATLTALFVGSLAFLSLKRRGIQNIFVWLASGALIGVSVSLYFMDIRWIFMYAVVGSLTGIIARQLNSREMQ